ncbi:hypothetical protein [Haloarcula nitratireducens]|uniref:Uncharacterized protein n=1 Tax=Haloarcula nitratireducens TaxID=2487749 RepID=A0AAW4PJ89_9EURY|nr:hypothetical protein [Halomicroarcula nitratireducens]MBX0298036.1 hypothetical protein [Halomicroarcula nitratireducens]
MPPPATTDESTQWPNWREDTHPLDYEDHDIRIIFGEQLSGTADVPRPEPATFGDFDPNPDGPDPDVWPLDHYDPGAPAAVENLVRITNTFPAPHVAWVTPEYIDWKYGHDPRSIEVAPEDLPSGQQPTHATGTVEVTAGDPSMELTDDRVEALQRLIALWNGEFVRGHHLLADKLPSWDTLFGDLQQAELERLRTDPTVDQTLVEAFGDHAWFAEEQSVFLRTQHILRKTVEYAPTLKTRTLISEREEFSALRGDPKEGLTHRVTVGLCAVHYALQGWDTWSYQPVDDYVVDLVAESPTGERHFLEVLTGHHNWELHRSTYRKLADLDQEGTPIVAFDARDTAYDICNHWHRAGLGELPLGPFDSTPRIAWGREKIQEAYAEAGTDWVIGDWFTTDWLWRQTFGSEGPAVDDDFYLSLTW